MRGGWRFSRRKELIQEYLETAEEAGWEQRVKIARSRLSTSTPLATPVT